MDYLREVQSNENRNKPIGFGNQLLIVAISERRVSAWLGLEPVWGVWMSELEVRRPLQMMVSLLWMLQWEGSWFGVWWNWDQWGLS